MEQIGLLAIQGAYRDHVKFFDKKRFKCSLVRNNSELKHVDKLIIPGGESTVITKYLRKYNMVDSIKEKIDDGMKVWGICAGSIVVSKIVDGNKNDLSLIDIEVKRNAYGRQKNSFIVNCDVNFLNLKKFPHYFIRAPRIIKTGKSVEILNEFKGDPICVKNDNIFITTFHPELTERSDFHEYFLERF